MTVIDISAKMQNGNGSLHLKPNLTLRATSEKTLKLATADVQKPGPGQALVHVRATGVCGSDIHFWKHAGLGPWKIEDEVSVGHESGGIVVAVGSGVTNVSVGDKVAIEPGVPCSQPTCDKCMRGEYNMCPDVKFYSVPPDHGTLTRYHCHPAAWLHKVPQSFTYQQIALLEPMSVCLRAAERADARLGQASLVMGCGPIGVAMAAVLHAAGCAPIAIADVVEERLAFAKRWMPFLTTIRVNPTDAPQRTASAICQAFGDVKTGLQPELIMECTGVESSVNASCYACKPTGLVFVVGVGAPIQSIPFMHMSTNEIDLKFLFRYRHTWPKAIMLTQTGAIDLAPLVTNTFPLEKAKEALEHSADRSKFSMKTVIVDGEDDD